MADRSADLASFLRARRAAVTPRQAGLVPGDGRRVRGLRREELALLAGLSTDYYRRLEQGRERRPSLQVLRALAGALQLDAHATAYLVSLVHPAPFALPTHGTTVSPGVRVLLDSGLRVPALVVDRHARPGDQWRGRYHSLCLHDPVWYDHLPYIKFPDNWPVFTPKDKIGDWLEFYTRVMEIPYWSSTTATSATAGCSYSTSSISRGYTL